MYLKSIELYGFKSFANKSKISFRPKISAVVGPNGCGKSNIVDAVKWCIGEMSWKSLRLPSLVDVIFGGTSRRQPLNFAEVSLTFDNESGKLPLNFREVTVTRKIYRSDESEYFINKVQCRLKDIREMFLNTGVGSAGYAIIDQGEVEFVLSANPQERRSLFEEAAGVSKYKARREEALRKLEKVDMDLGRLFDAMKLINENIVKLDKEAKKARLQQKYREELKENEIALLTRNAAECQERIKRGTLEIEPVNREIDEFSINLTSLEGEMSALNINLAQKREEERLLNESISVLKTSKVNAEGKIVSNENLIGEIERGQEELDRLRQRDENELKKSLPLMEEVGVKIDDYERQAQTLKSGLEALFSRETDISSKISEISDLILRKESEITASYEKEKEISGSMIKLESDISHIREDVLLLSKEEQGLKKREEEILEKEKVLNERILTANGLLADRERDFSSLEKEKSEIENSLSGLRKKLSEITHQRARDESRLETVRSQGEKDPYWVGISAIVNAHLEGIKGTLRHSIEIEPEYSLLVQESLGVFLDSLVCENVESAERAIEYLKSIGKGRARFLVLDKIGPSDFGGVSIPNTVNLLSKIKYPAEYENLLKALLNQTYVSVKNVYGPFWISGGVGDVQSAEPYWSEEETLREKVESGKKEEEKLLLEISNLETQSRQLAERLRSVRETVSTDKINVEKIKSEADDLLRQKEHVAKEFSLVRTDFANKEKEIKEKESSFFSLKKELEDLQSKVVSLNAETQEKEKEKTLLLEDYTVVKEEIGAKTATLKGGEKNLENLRQEHQRLSSLAQRLKKEIEDFGVRKQEQVSRIDSLKQEISQLKDSLQTLRDELSDKEMLQVQLRKEVGDLQSEYEQRNVRLKEIKDVLQDLESKKHEMEMTINSDRTRLEDIKTRFAEEWNMTYEEAAEKYSQVEPDEERIRFLKKRIENMGPINMTAPQEYDALINRYNFLNSQVEDLNKAKSDLKSAINKINETTRINFKNTFDRVKAHFSQIYGILFNGGEANLVLTEPENLLETGVEIMAHPPGKKLVSIAQLSGGEKALTALALLFSFFCVNPSPFCIMDEAESALDEANTERFCRLVKEFSRDTQFILITHNKKTMEVADVLYGVTMEEMGVSKVVSVDLKRASDMIDDGRKPVAGVR